MVVLRGLWIGDPFGDPLGDPLFNKFEYW
jgi:hypothetical protein